MKKAADMMNTKTIDCDNTLVVIIGPTAVGKTSISIAIAQLLQTEIVSADSRQFYRELQIGTAAPTEQERAIVPHHFVHNLSVFDSFNASDYEQQALSVVENVFSKNKYCVVTGGSGLYIDALLYGFDNLPAACLDTRNSIEGVYASDGLPGLRMWLKKIDPAFYAQVDLANPNRIKRAIEVTLTSGMPYSELRTKNHRKRPFTTKCIVLNRPRPELFHRINQRVDLMVQQGLIEEAIEYFAYRNLNALNTVGYKELFDWLSGSYSLQVALEKVKTHTRRFAKRQLTWNRKYQDALWAHPDSMDEIMKFIQSPPQQ